MDKSKSDSILFSYNCCELCLWIEFRMISYLKLKPNNISNSHRAQNTRVYGSVYGVCIENRPLILVYY